MERIITNSIIGDFESYLLLDEKSKNATQKYLRDVRAFYGLSGAREITKVIVMEFKASLVANYKIASNNSANTAANAFLWFMGWIDCCIKQVKAQKSFLF